MARKRLAAEQIVTKLRQIEVLQGQGKTIAMACKEAGTTEHVIEWVLDRLDLILLMTVNPGFGGQAFIPAVVDKIRRVKALIGNRPIDIEVDGGITPETAPLVVKAGANVLVAGSAVFKGNSTEAYVENIQALRLAANC